MELLIDFNVFVKKKKKISEVYKDVFLEDKQVLKRKCQCGQENEGWFLHLFRHSCLDK